MKLEEPCPFQVGQMVVYRPSIRGCGLSVMTDLSNLVPGQRYRVVRVVKGYYVVVEGFENSSGGGLCWCNEIGSIN